MNSSHKYTTRLSTGTIKRKYIPDNDEDNHSDNHSDNDSDDNSESVNSDTEIILKNNNPKSLSKLEYYKLLNKLYPSNFSKNRIANQKNIDSFKFNFDLPPEELNNGEQQLYRISKKYSKFNHVKKKNKHFHPYSLNKKFHNNSDNSNINIIFNINDNKNNDYNIEDLEDLENEYDQEHLENEYDQEDQENQENKYDEEDEYINKKKQATKILFNLLKKNISRNNLNSKNNHHNDENEFNNINDNKFPSFYDFLKEREIKELDEKNEYLNNKKYKNFKSTSKDLKLLTSVSTAEWCKSWLYEMVHVPDYFPTFMYQDMFRMRDFSQKK